MATLAWLNRLDGDNRSNFNCNNRNLNNDNGSVFGIVLATRMYQMDKLSYEHLYSMGNLILAWRKARKGKTLHNDVINFEKNLERNLLNLYLELRNKTYRPKPLKTFILRDPKTRKISKSDFGGRIVHHALINSIGQEFQKSFIYDSCANQIGKGTLFALERFDKFRRKVTKNNKRIAFCLKADIKHYFEEVDHQILLSILKDKIEDDNIIWLVEQILRNNTNSKWQREREIPLFARRKRKVCLSVITLLNFSPMSI